MNVNEINNLTTAIIGSAITVHKTLGPGLLESAYEACLAAELRFREIKFERQKPLPLIYRTLKLDCGYRMDFVVESQIILELKSVELLMPIHQAQLLSYLKLAHLKIGLLINFNVPVLSKGIRRVVNEFPDTPRTLRTLR